MNTVLPFPHTMRAKKHDLLPEMQCQAAIVKITQARHTIKVAAESVQESAEAIYALVQESKIKPTPDHWAILASAGILCAAIKSANEFSSGATNERP
jgi:hypothetical protein